MGLSTGGSGAKLEKKLQYLPMKLSSKEGSFLCMIGRSHKTGLWMVQKHKLYFRKGAVLWKNGTGVDSIIVQLEDWSQRGSQFHSSFLCHSGIVCQKMAA